MHANLKFCLHHVLHCFLTEYLFYSNNETCLYKSILREKDLVGWLVVLEFNATLTVRVISWWSVTHIVFPGFLTPVLTQLSFQSYRLLFSNASAELRGKNTLERKFASTSHWTNRSWVRYAHHWATWVGLREKEKMHVTSIVSFSYNFFQTHLFVQVVKISARG